ncbi:hypothetical protein J2Z62_000122 [Mycoplasmoides fastidiosum]|uniref:Lipoprotein n=1 Tax=Mycoplasmoides fastidiosum TaxID=92758 RepID=A0ABU0LYB4_9BACT|nr:hypothetical protein [Mycoplasmoides fastidiosum]MDQ0513684.1 hypothetical protein [Mycoplasmoides fastidiosum]UUD37897.1 hypothetical protein NPA10_00670 [Mycoplasmoides fastidiosum]
MKKNRLFKFSKLWLCILSFGLISNFVLSACSQQVQSQKYDNKSETNSKLSNDSGHNKNSSIDYSNNNKNNPKSQSNLDSNKQSQIDDNFPSDHPSDNQSDSYNESDLKSKINNSPQKNNFNSAKTDSKSDKKNTIARASHKQIEEIEVLVKNKEFQHLLEYENRTNRDRIFYNLFDNLSLSFSFKNNRVVEKTLSSLNIDKQKNRHKFFSRQSKSTPVIKIPNLLEQLKSGIGGIFTKTENKNQRTNFETIFNKLITNTEDLITKINGILDDNSQDNLQRNQNDFISSIQKYLTAPPQDLEQVLGEVLKNQETYFENLNLLANKIIIIKESIIRLESALKEIKNFKNINSSLFSHNDDNENFLNNFQNFLDALENQVLFLINRNKNDSDPDKLKSDSSLLGEIQQILEQYEIIKNELSKTVQLIVFNKNLLINDAEAINLLALNSNKILNNDINALKIADKNQDNKSIYDVLTNVDQNQTSIKTVLEKIQKISDADTNHKLTTELGDFQIKWKTFKKLIWETRNEQETIFPFIELAKELDNQILKASSYQDVLKISAIINEISNIYSKITNFVSQNKDNFLGFEDVDYFSISWDDSISEIEEETSEINIFMQKLDTLIKQEKNDTPTNNDFSFAKLKTELEKLQNDDLELRNGNANFLSKVSEILAKLLDLNVLTEKNKLTLELAEKFNYGRA